MKTNNSKEGHFDYNDFRRVQYFDGEILNKQIFVAEQTYHHEKRKLLNRMLHGWGVVCGLKVKATNPPSSKILVEPGLALDCHGNEIYVCEDQTVDLSIEPCMKKQKTNPCPGDTEEMPEDTALYVVIRYDEINSDQVPSYAPSADCGEKKCGYSRKREGFCIEIWDKPPQTPKQNSTDMPCSEPFKFPPCCPDQHYIVLATIRCKERTYMFFSSSTQSFGEGDQVEIRYQIKRKLTDVCIGSAYGIVVTDTYSYETSQDLKSLKWNEKPDNLGDKFEIDGKFELPAEHSYEISYTVKAKQNAKGSADLGSPVSLGFLDNDQTIYFDTPKIPIYIGTTEAKRGNIIPDSMIRNMENRQFAITFPLLSWFMSSRGMKEGQLLSGNVSSTCELMSDKLFGKSNIKLIEERLKIQEERQTLLEKTIEKLDSTSKRLGEFKKLEDRVKKLESTEQK